MAKVNRQELYESYKTTSPWVSEFSRELEKNADHLDYLKQYLNQRNQNNFSTIDEKMADIKERIGFEFSNKVINELNKTSDTSEASILGTGGSEIKIAKYDHSKEDIGKMQSILNYVKDMAKNESHLDPATVVSRCREEADLGFNNLRVNMAKFKEFVDKELQQYSSKSEDGVVYIPRESESSDNSETDEAEYISHANPKR
jgi:Asp-tRNA(Asn)/Glu-tRNA(Gln) amidotransferase C subunit